MVSGSAGIPTRSFESLRRIYEHLEPGGLLLLDNEVPYTVAGIWPNWPKEERRALPKPWPELGAGERVARHHGRAADAQLSRRELL